MWVADRSVLRNDGKECSAGTKVRSQEGNKSKLNYALGTMGQRLEMEVGDGLRLGFNLCVVPSPVEWCLRIYRRIGLGTESWSVR